MRTESHRGCPEEEQGIGVPLLIGHRGAPVTAPEHTAASYRAAIRQGATAVEPDIVISRDGIPVIRHEHALGGTTDIAARPEFAARRRPHRPDDRCDCDPSQRERPDWFVEDLDWAEISTLTAREPWPDVRPASASAAGDHTVLRLGDLIELVDLASTAASEERPALIVELKTPGLFARAGHDAAAIVADEIAAFGDVHTFDTLVLESFEHDALREVRWQGLPVGLVPLLDDFAVPRGRASQRLVPSNFDSFAEWADGVSLRHSLLGVDRLEDAGDPVLGRRLVDGARARNLAVLTWTLRPENQFLPPAFAGQPEAYWRGILRTGVDGVFADAPGQVAPLLSEFACSDRASRGRSVRRLAG